jgi:hypothetical protein
MSWDNMNDANAKSSDTTPKSSKKSKHHSGGGGDSSSTSTPKSNEFSDVDYKLTGEETLENSFDRPTKDKRRIRGQKTAIYGPTGGGKTRWGLSWIRLNEKDVQEDIQEWNLPGPKHDKAIETFMTAFKNKAIIPGIPMIIFGTEISTEDCLYGDDQWDMVAEHVDHDIMFKEMYHTFEDGPEQGEEDPLACLKDYNKHWAILLKHPPETGTVMVDSGTHILSWRHSYIRRKVMKIPASAREQGVPTRFWFWRNEKQESFQLGLRNITANTIVTWKMAKDQEGHETDQPRWHDDTSGHLSNNVLYMPLDEEKDRFKVVVKKCRQTREFRFKTIVYPTAIKFVGLLIKAFTIDDIKKLEV